VAAQLLFRPARVVLALAHLLETSADEEIGGSAGGRDLLRSRDGG